MLLSGVVIMVSAPYINLHKQFQKARNGDTLSQRMLGFDYETGNASSYSRGRILKNEKQAIYWYTKAADGGDHKAGFFLARLYERKKSLQEAIKWYTKSATQGDAEAAKRLSLVYEQGDLGQAVDTRKSAYWQRLSKKNSLKVQEE